ALLHGVAALLHAPVRAADRLRRRDHADRQRRAHVRLRARRPLAGATTACGRDDAPARGGAASASPALEARAVLLLLPARVELAGTCVAFCTTWRIARITSSGC